MNYWLNRFAFVLISAALLTGQNVQAHLFDPEHDTGENAAEVTVSQTVPGNKFCPVSPDEEIDPNYYIDYNGRRIYFCCRRCKVKFEAAPEKYLANLPDIPTSDSSGDSDSVQLVSADESNEESASEHEHSGDVDADHESSEEREHDHSTDHGSDSDFALIPYLGRFHVMVIHFPIALLSVAALLAFFGFIRKDKKYHEAIRYCLGIGALSALGAVALGLANAVNADYVGTLEQVFRWHRILGISTAAVAVIAWVAFEVSIKNEGKKIPVFPLLLVMLAALLVGITGHLGGSLVFGWEYLIP